MGTDLLIRRGKSGAMAAPRGVELDQPGGGAGHAVLEQERGDALHRRGELLEQPGVQGGGVPAPPGVRLVPAAAPAAPGVDPEGGVACHSLLVAEVLLRRAVHLWGGG